MLFLFMIAGLLASCDYSYEETISYQVNEPVVMSESAFRASVKVTNEQKQINNYGKICFYNGFLYISEPEVGIHIIDNRNPVQPHNVGFIELLGNADIAVKNDVLYADALIDLVWFDITDPANPKLKERLENAFPEAYSLPTNNEYICDYSMAYNENGMLKGLVVGWKLIQRNETVEKYYERYNWGGGVYSEDALSNSKTTSAGVNGSMSRFTLYKDYLYAVIRYQMQIFDISGEKPVKVSDEYENYVGDVETIFSYKDKMFLGMPTGMSIYSVENPLKPERCSSIDHVLGCDPVVVDDDLAYVTVHSGNFCGQNNDELFIVDVKDAYHPKQLVSYTMTNPKGLGIDSEKKTLFLCDDGLKVFKIGDPQTLISNQIIHIKGLDGFDLIPYDNVLMLIADDGLYQYDYSDLNNFKYLSVIPINKKNSN
jgi:hypothetical protein